METETKADESQANKTVVIGYCYWGKGDTLPEAKAQFSKQGGRLSDGYLIVVFDDGAVFTGVDDLGYYHWEHPDGPGYQPTTTMVEPKGRK